MKCDKCNLDFPEPKIQDSHDIPKYMGGKDKDGRHWLCEDCHKKYEFDVLKLSVMTLIKNSSKETKKKCCGSAKIVAKYFFKQKKR